MADDRPAPGAHGSVPDAEPRARLCPRCGDAPLSGRAPWERCARCRGTFVERDAVARILRAGGAPLPTGDPYRGTGKFEARPEGAVRYLRCPDCSGLMHRTRVLERVGVVVDICVRHGVWFDEGDLEQALDHLREQPGRSVAAQEEGAQVLGALFALFFRGPP